MQIKETMQRYGYTPTSLAKKMGVYASTVIRLTEGNPTVDKLEELARWIGCSRWEFFKDEIEAAGYRLTEEPAPQPQEKAEAASAEQQQAVGGEGGAAGLPFGCGEPSAIGQQAIICPHCHQALVMNIASYEQK